MAGIKWTKEEDVFLMENYENLDTEKILIGLSKRSWDAIKLRAEKLGIRRYNNKNRLANLKILLEDTNETYYWIGFIMADGHIHNSRRLKICLSIKDREQLDKFKKFIDYSEDLTIRNNKGHYNISISVMDTKYLKMLCDKFDIKHNKTYNQCDIKKIKNDKLLLSLMIGFIDGDGSIKNQTGRKDFRLNIKCHKSWKENLEYILNTIIRITGVDCKTVVKHTKCRRYSLINVTNSTALKKLKQEMLKLKIPYMKRKWDIIDENYETFYERKQKHFKQFLEIFKNNPKMKVKDLAETMNLSEECIYGYKRQNKKENPFLIYSIK